MSSRGNLHPWFVVGIGVLLFAILPLVRKVEGVKKPADAYEGTWGGSFQTAVDNKTVWEDVPGPHKEAVLYFTLQNENNALGYDGPGEIYFLGSDAPRKIFVNKFRPQADGTADLYIDLQNAWYLSFQGVLHKDGTLTLEAGNPETSQMKAQLHRGTEDDFKKQMERAKSQAGSLKR